MNPLRKAFAALLVGSSVHHALFIAVSKVSGSDTTPIPTHHTSVLSTPEIEKRIDFNDDVATSQGITDSKSRFPTLAEPSALPGDMEEDENAGRPPGKLSRRDSNNDITSILPSDQDKRSDVVERSPYYFYHSYRFNQAKLYRGNFHCSIQTTVPKPTKRSFDISERT